MHNSLLFKNILLLFILFGCGTQQNSDTPKSTITIHEDGPKQSDEINVSKAIETLKSQMEGILKIYVAKDNRDLFVYQRLDSFEKSYALYDYDITGDIPKLRNTIMSGYRAYVHDLIPLSHGYIVYDKGVFNATIVLYNYIAQKSVRKYILNNSYPDMTISRDEKTLSVDEYRLDISDIFTTYDTFKLHEDNLEYDIDQNIIIDRYNRLVWDKTIYYETEGNLYTFDEALEQCSQKNGYAWRLPTMKEVIMFTKGKSDYFKESYFKLLPSFKGYWLQRDGQMPALEQIDRSWVYGSDYFMDTAVEEKHLVRCVANME